MNDKDNEEFDIFFADILKNTDSLWYLPFELEYKNSMFDAFKAACELKQKEIDFLEAMNGRLEEARIAHLETSEKYQAENKKLREALELIAGEQEFFDEISDRSKTVRARSTKRSG